MSTSKTHMPRDLRHKCRAVIHSASIAAAAAGATPLPVADTIPITAAQVTMVVALGKIFDLDISRSMAESILGAGIAQSVGQKLASTLKAFPGVGTVVGGMISATTAGSLTESLGLLVADDFYRISIGKEPKNITPSTKKAIANLYKFTKSNFS